MSDNQELNPGEVQNPSSLPADPIATDRAPFQDLPSPLSLAELRAAVSAQDYPTAHGILIGRSSMFDPAAWAIFELDRERHQFGGSPRRSNGGA